MKGERSSQPLFHSVDKDGTHWLFVIRSDDRWAILRNGEEVDVGTAQHASITAAVDKFLSLTRGGLRGDTSRRAPVGEQPIGLSEKLPASAPAAR